MQIVSLIGPSQNALQEQIQRSTQADCLEWRLDLWDPLSIDALHALKQWGAKPILLTPGKNISAQQLITLSALQPEFIDLDSSIAAALQTIVQRYFASTKLIISSHYFDAPPKNIPETLKNIQKDPAWHYKLACQVSSSTETLNILEHTQHVKNLSVIPMGELGQFGRLLAHTEGGHLCYFAPDDRSKSASGQLTLNEAILCYNLDKKEKKTAIYGLIGDPIDRSPSHVTHNRFFKAQGFEALYIKLSVRNEELGNFLNAAKKHPFKGFSVTMPHKETICSYLDHIDSLAKKIGAVNTVCCHTNQLYGFNTDGPGALKVITRHTPIENAEILILGAGGTARAIACCCKNEGARVTLVTRDKGKCQKLIQELNCSVITQKELETNTPFCDVLIHAAPPAAYTLPLNLSSKTVVFETNIGLAPTPLLQEALIKGHRTISGLEFFFEQARLQLELFRLFT